MKTTGFRCPSCGQAHKMVADDTEVTMNEEMTIMTINGHALEAGREVSLVEDLSLTCPECQAVSLSIDWIRAFKDPSIFFDMETLCHCGGELWMDKIPGSSLYGFVCEKCEWVKPNKIVSGA